MIVSNHRLREQGARFESSVIRPIESARAIEAGANSMPVNFQEFLAALSGLSRDQIRQAGQRYMPGIDPKAPNLRIV